MFGDRARVRYTGRIVGNIEFKAYQIGPLRIGIVRRERTMVWSFFIDFGMPLSTKPEGHSNI